MGRIRSPPGKGKAAPLNPERWECRRGVQTRQEDEYDGMQKEGSSARVARCEGNALAVRRRRRRTETTHTVVSRGLLHYSNSSRDPSPPVRLVSSEGLVHFGGLFRRGFFAEGVFADVHSVMRFLATANAHFLRARHKLLRGLSGSTGDMSEVSPMEEHHPHHVHHDYTVRPIADGVSRNRRPRFGAACREPRLRRFSLTAERDARATRALARAPRDRHRAS